jgi:hypothetical protein
MKASAFAINAVAEEAGVVAARCVTILSSARAIRSAASPSGASAGGLADSPGIFRCAGAAALWGAALRDFFDIFSLPDNAPLTGLAGGRKRRW